MTVPGHAAGVRSVEFSPDGRAVLTTSTDGVTKRSDISANGSREWVTLEATAPLDNLKISPDGSTIIAGSVESDDGAFEWDVTDPEFGRPIALPDQITEANLRFGFVTRDWTRVFGITQDLTIVVWERGTWVEINRIRTSGDLGEVTATHDGALFANVGRSEVEIYDVESGDVVRSWPVISTTPPASPALPTSALTRHCWPQEPARGSRCGASRMAQCCSRTKQRMHPRSFLCASALTVPGWPSPLRMRRSECGTYRLVNREARS